jgi:RimJ/RimL family protein N-acetyltransferase
MSLPLEVPVLETARLLIRPFAMTDLADARRLFDVALIGAEIGTETIDTLEERASWLAWSALNSAQLARLYQPPYGDRAVVLRSSGELIGSCGYVPCLCPFDQLPGFNPDVPNGLNPGLFSPEFGLFYAISPAYRRQGNASEAARAMLDYAFRSLRLKRMVATTTYDNLASQAVMRRLGMTLLNNPPPDPPWFQVVGVLENDRISYLSQTHNN